MTPEQREELIVSTLPLIKHIAHKVMMRLPATIEMHDLINAGVLGLLDAVDKFEPERGVKFKTYAEVRIRGTILDSLRDLDWAPRSLRKKEQGSRTGLYGTGTKTWSSGHRRGGFRSVGRQYRRLSCPCRSAACLTVGSFEAAGESDEKG
jgi:RNA polymerase sigma factor for flagellar operon FliA